MTTTVRPVHGKARPAKKKELVARLETNWRAFAAVGSAGTTVKPMHSGVLIRSGLPMPFFNMGFVDATVRRPDRAVAAAESFFSGVPFMLVVPDGHVELALACESAGLHFEEVVPGMALTSVPEVAFDPAIRIEPVAAHAQTAFCDVLCECFGIAPEIGRAYTSPRYFETDALHDVIAYMGPEPVAVASTFESLGVAGVYNVATMPKHRGNGYGETVTWAAIQGATQRGCHTITLESTPMGFGVYRRMGFEVVSRYACYTNGSIA